MSLTSNIRHRCSCICHTGSAGYCHMGSAGDCHTGSAGDGCRDARLATGD